MPEKVSGWQVADTVFKTRREANEYEIGLKFDEIVSNFNVKTEDDSNHRRSFLYADDVVQMVKEVKSGKGEADDGQE